MALKNERGRKDKEEDDDWGGGGGGRGGDFSPNPSSKVCGHKEATMLFLRPHVGLEIFNSRVCSHASSAPGNDAGGHEGCLKFLRIACAATRRWAAFWDTACLAYVDRESVTAAWAAREWVRGGEGGAAAVGGRERNACRSCWRRCDESPKGICFTCTSATWGGSWDPYDHGPFFRSEQEEEREEAQGPRHPPKTTAKDIIPGT